MDKRCFVKIWGVEGQGDGPTYKLAAQRAVRDAVAKADLKCGPTYTATLTFAQVNQLAVTRAQVSE